MWCNAWTLATRSLGTLSNLIKTKFVHVQYLISFIPYSSVTDSTSLLHLIKVYKSHDPMQSVPSMYVETDPICACELESQRGFSFCSIFLTPQNYNTMYHNLPNLTQSSLVAVTWPLDPLLWFLIHNQSKHNNWHTLENKQYNYWERVYIYVCINKHIFVIFNSFQT